MLKTDIKLITSAKEVLRKVPTNFHTRFKGFTGDIFEEDGRENPRKKSTWLQIS